MNPAPAYVLTVSRADGSGAVTEPLEDIAAFVDANDIEPEEAEALARLEVGDECLFGGGAAPLASVRRVA